MYFIPLGLLLGEQVEVSGAAGLAADQISLLTVPACLRNLLASTLGNVVGGGLLVGLVYWFIYLRKQRDGHG
jgi:formate/nitrite transporter FocA (FNT family)